MWHLLRLHGFIPHFAKICIRFAQSKFGANPFFFLTGRLLEISSNKAIATKLIVLNARKYIRSV